nr:hypothetical protein [Tanacetum cinerariifolium]
MSLRLLWYDRCFEWFEYADVGFPLSQSLWNTSFSSLLNTVLLSGPLFLGDSEWPRLGSRLLDMLRACLDLSLSLRLDIRKNYMNKGKEIVNSPQPIYDQEPSIGAEDDEMSKDKEIDKLMALISLSSTGYENQRIGNVAGARETVGSIVKPKWVKDAAYHREKMLLCKQEDAGIQLNAEQADWRNDTDDDELEDQELEAHYMYMAQIQEVSPDAADFGPIFDTKPCKMYQMVINIMCLPLKVNILSNLNLFMTHILLNKMHIT